MVSKVRIVFREMDQDESGSLNREEVASLAVTMGIPLTEQDMAAAMADMDPSGDGANSVMRA